jgi:predicted HTH domain antitoxin
MEQVTNALTTALAAVFLSAMIVEIRRRQKQLQELYNVLDVQDKQIVMELDGMVERGEIKPYADHDGSG